MNINIADLAYTSLDTLTAFSMDGDFLYCIDEMQNAKIANSQEKDDITGKQGRKLNSLKKNKSATLTATNGLMSMGVLETQTGATATTGNQTVRWSETVTVNSSNQATLTYKAVGTAGAEIVSAHKKHDGYLDEALEQAASAAEGKFAYDAATKKLTFHTDITEGTTIYVVYDRTVTAGNKLANNSDTYSKKVQIYVDGTAEDICGNIFRIQFYFPMADVQGNFDFSMGDGQATHAFEAEALAGGCATAGELWTYTVIADDATDVSA